MPDAEVAGKLFAELDLRFAPLIWLSGFLATIAIASRLGLRAPSIRRLLSVFWSLPILLWALLSVWGLISLCRSGHALASPIPMQRQIFVSLYGLVLAVAASGVILACHQGLAATRRLKGWFVTLIIADVLFAQVVCFVMLYRLPR